MKKQKKKKKSEKKITQSMWFLHMCGYTLFPARSKIHFSVKVTDESWFKSLFIAITWNKSSECLFLCSTEEQKLWKEMRMRKIIFSFGWTVPNMSNSSTVHMRNLLSTVQAHSSIIYYYYGMFLNLTYPYTNSPTHTCWTRSRERNWQVWVFTLLR